MDGSKRSAHSNAYALGEKEHKTKAYLANYRFLMGFWSSSVVLYDNMVKNLNTNEILAILGHEIGHHKFNRI